ncbi:MAG: ECF transporter S component, partial [Anaerolineae bacterium]
MRPGIEVNLMSRNSFDPRLLGSMVMMTAIVFVLTRVIQVPTPIVGYIHLGDVGIFFSALAFGPAVGAVAGGLGTALADLTSPYAQWAIFSLLIHGAQGLVAGWLVMKLQGVKGILAAAAAGCVIVVGGYLLAGWILVGLGAALTEIPLNVVQVITGAVISIPL